jgi:hypothetical protein
MSKNKKYRLNKLIKKQPSVFASEPQWVQTSTFIIKPIPISILELQSLQQNDVIQVTDLERNIHGFLVNYKEKVRF